VRSLEESIGRSLFDRNAQFVRLTTDGEAMLGYARELLAVLARARQQFAQPPLEGLVRFGMVENFGATVLPEILGRLRREHPRFEVITETGTSPDLLRRLDAGSSDLVLAKRVAGRQQGAFLCRQRRKSRFLKLPRFRSCQLHDYELFVWNLGEARLIEA
jgi:DNA-binding transcriptional LysR family regulator